MTDTPPSSWVYLSGIYSSQPVSPRRITPVPFGGDQDCLRMLREAQKEMSARSSARVSPISSALMSARVSPISSARVSLASTGCRTTPAASPKSPPNSPNTELTDMSEELKGVHINHIQQDLSDPRTTRLVWELCSRPNVSPPTSGPLVQSKNMGKKKKRTVDNNEAMTGTVVCTLVITNLLSLMLGVGIGVYLYRRGGRLLEVAYD